MTTADIVTMLKTDLGVTHSRRDENYTALVETAIKELARKGIHIDIETAEIDDIMLISDFAAWNYRKRMENVPLSNNLRIRIYNRVVRERAKRQDE